MLPKPYEPYPTRLDIKPLNKRIHYPINDYGAVCQAVYETPPHSFPWNFFGGRRLRFHPEEAGRLGSAILLKEEQKAQTDRHDDDDGVNRLGRPRPRPALALVALHVNFAGLASAVGILLFTHDANPSPSGCQSKRRS